VVDEHVRGAPEVVVRGGAEERCLSVMADRDGEADVIEGGDVARLQFGLL